MRARSRPRSNRKLKPESGVKRLAEGRSPRPDKRQTSGLAAYTQPYLLGMVGCNAQGTAKAPRHIRGGDTYPLRRCVSPASILHPRRIQTRYCSRPSTDTTKQSLGEMLLALLYPMLL